MAFPGCLLKERVENSVSLLLFQHHHPITPGPHPQNLIKSESESRSVVSVSPRPHGLHSPWNSPGQNTGMGSLSLLQEIVPTQRSIPGLPYCRWVLYQLSHKGSPKILECVVYPFPRGSSQPRNQTQGLLHCRQILYQLSYLGTFE